jgi:hypothetical protein
VLPVRRSDTRKGIGEDMSKNHEGDVRQYTHLEEAWYAKSSLEGRDFVDEVMFGFYSPDGGTSGEMGMRWINLGTKWRRGHEVPHFAPQLQCFSDAWSALAQFKDVIDALAEVDGEDITPGQFCEILDRCGFIDATPRDEKKRKQVEASYSKEGQKEG